MAAEFENPDPYADRREYPREQVRIPAKALFGKGSEAIDCIIVDRSMKGMRIRLGPGQSVPNSFMVLETAAARVHEVVAAWKAYPDVGLSVHKAYDIRTAAGPNADQLRRVWREATSR